MVDITFILTNYETYIFGNAIYMALVFMLIMGLITVKYRMPLDVYMVLFPPIIGLLVSPMFPGLNPLMLIGIGIVIGIALIALIKR